MTEYVNGRLPKIYSQEGLSAAVQTLQREMNDVQQVMSPQYLKEIEPAFQRLQSRIDAVVRDVRRVESKLGHAQKAADLARSAAERALQAADFTGTYIADIHNAFAEEVLTRLDAIEGRFKKRADDEVVARAVRQMDAEFEYAVKYGDGSMPWAPPKPTHDYTGPGWLTMADEAKAEPPKPIAVAQSWVLPWAETVPESPKPVTNEEYAAAVGVVDRYWDEYGKKTP